MKLTREMIVAHNPCIDGLEWYDKNGSDDLLDTLLRVDDYRPDWARWLFLKLMDHSERLEIAIYSANLVLHIFEERFPGDKRPREAIEAIKKCLSVGLTAAANSANAASYAAAAAADAAAAGKKTRKPLPKNRRKQLDLVAEYKSLKEIESKTTARIQEIRSIVIANGSVETASGSLVIETSTRRGAPSIAELEEAGEYERMNQKGLIKNTQVQIVRMILKKAGAA